MAAINDELGRNGLEIRELFSIKILHDYIQKQ